MSAPRVAQLRSLTTGFSRSDTLRVGEIVRSPPWGRAVGETPAPRRIQSCAACDLGLLSVVNAQRCVSLLARVRGTGARARIAGRSWQLRTQLFFAGLQVRVMSVVEQTSSGESRVRLSDGERDSRRIDGDPTLPLPSPLPAAVTRH